jgi:pimeloyl-ACP methyl ester carboxylesterase
MSPSSLSRRGLIGLLAVRTLSAMSFSAIEPRALRHARISDAEIPGGVTQREHVFTCPLDWTAAADGAAPTIDVYVRELVLSKHAASAATLPCLIFLQGGPGFPAPRPSAPLGGWMKSALAERFRVLLLDQRGVGRSTAATGETLAARGDAAAQAAYLSHLRADSIVRDCEAVRRALVGEKGKVSLLGQSFGGFIALSYLSMCPDSLERVLLTCGLAPVGQPADELYRRTFARMRERNRRFYARYPEHVEQVCARRSAPRDAVWRGVRRERGRGRDVRGYGELRLLALAGWVCRCKAAHARPRACPAAPSDARACTAGRPDLHRASVRSTFPPSGQVKTIVRALRASPQQLPSGGTLTARRFLQLGLLLGSSTGFEALHQLLEAPFLGGLAMPAADGSADGAPPRLSREFLKDVEARQAGFESNPLYWLLHEPIYATGGAQPTAWAAERVLRDELVGSPFDADAVLDADAAAAADGVPSASASGAPVYFSGEMVYSWMADDYAELRGLKGAAELLAAKADWPPLYDEAALRDTRVPVACLIAYDDIYVERDFSEAVAKLLGDKCVVWVSNQFAHSALRDDPAVFSKLLEMSQGEAGIPC